MQPQYTSSLEVWRKMRDTLAGERQVQTRSLEQNSQWKKCDNVDSTSITTLDQYLRMSEGLRSHSKGWGRFCDYVYRSMFYPFPLTIKNQSLGMINSQDPVIELPASMEYLRTDATPTQELLKQVMSCINAEQLAVGRIGLLLETTISKQEPFNIVHYVAESIVDWEYNLVGGEQIATWVKLKEIVSERVNGAFTNVTKYRILTLDENGDYFQYVTEEVNEAPEDYQMVAEENRVYPMIREQKSKVIPFVSINVNSLGFGIEKPPLEGVSDASIKLFQGDAEYRDVLYWAGIATLVTTGMKDDEASNIRLGNGQAFNITDASGSASYLTAGADAVAPNKDNVESLKMYCASLGVDLLNQGVESGQALNARINVKTSMLKTLAKTGAYGLLTLLQMGADWLGVNEDIKIEANTEFGDTVYTAEELTKLSILVMNGDMSKQALFNVLKKQSLTSAETLEDEELIKEIALNEGSLV
jgi:hypothetical protein